MTIAPNWRRGMTMTLEEYRRQEKPVPLPPSRGTRLTERLPLPPGEGWMARAACKGHETEWWFPQFNERTTETLRNAQRICAGCPVQDQCRAYAQRHSLVGMWGLSHAAERTRDRRRVTGNGRPGTRPLGPTAVAILEALADGHWHDYDEVFTSVLSSIPTETAVRRQNTRRRNQGLDELAAHRMTKAAIGTGRRMVFVDTVNTLSRSNRVERGGGVLRLVKERE